MSKLTTPAIALTFGLAACGGTANRVPTKPQKYAQKAPASEQRMKTNQAVNGVVNENKLTTKPSRLDAQTAQMCGAIGAELVTDFDSGANLCIVEAAAPASLIGAEANEIGAAAAKAAKIATKGWLESQPSDWPAKGAFECTAQKGDFPPVCEAITPPNDMNWNTCRITKYTEGINTTVTAVCKGATR